MVIVEYYVSRHVLGRGLPHSPIDNRVLFDYYRSSVKAIALIFPKRIRAVR